MVELFLFCVVRDTCIHVCGCLCKMDSTTCTVSDIIKFTYYHVLPLTTVYFVSEVHCILNVLHSITP